MAPSGKTCCRIPLFKIFLILIFLNTLNFFFYIGVEPVNYIMIFSGGHVILIKSQQLLRRTPTGSCQLWTKMVFLFNLEGFFFFFLFPCLTSPARIFSVVLNGRGKSKHFCLAADLRGEDFHHKNDFNYCFSKTFLSVGLNKFIFIPAQ